jgi:hypothetical protein
MSSDEHTSTLSDFFGDRPDTSPESSSERTEPSSQSESSTTTSPQYDPGDTVPNEGLPDWCSWKARATDRDGYTVLSPITNNGATHVYPTSDYSIRFDRIGFLPNPTEVTEARTNSPFDPLRVSRPDLPTTYSEFEDDPSHSFTPVIAAQSIAYGGYAVVNDDILQDAYRLTQGSGHITPSHTRVTPLSAHYSLVEARDGSQHAYLIQNATSPLSESALESESYQPNVQSVDNISLPDDNKHVGDALRRLLPHISKLLDVELTEHSHQVGSSHVFESTEDTRYRIKSTSLKKVPKLFTLGDLSPLTGEIDLPFAHGVATIDLSDADYEHRYGDWLHDKLPNEKVLGASLRLNSNNSPYSQRPSREAKIQYYTLSIRQFDSRPDAISVNRSTTSTLGSVPFSNISYGAADDPAAH